MAEKKLLLREKEEGVEALGGGELLVGGLVPTAWGLLGLDGVFIECLVLKEGLQRFG